jgi:hypothetical protein
MGYFRYGIALAMALAVQGCHAVVPPAAAGGGPAAPAPAAAAPAQAAPTPAGPDHFRVVVWAAEEAADLPSFERVATRAKAAGATHVVISDGLPRARWEYQTPGDPYPGWYSYRPSVFKIFTPAALRPYIPQDYAAGVADLIAGRCAILRRLGLQGVFQANEPQVLPESVFHDHPLWRGPRVDQANRSTTPHWAACVDEPEVLALYREAFALLARRCPEVTMFRFVTTDAGSGLCWSPALYPGANGPAHCKDRPVADRVHGLMDAIQAGARDGSGRAVDIRLVQIEPEEWMIPTFPDPPGLARQLSAGMAINNLEAPTATPYIATAGWGSPQWTFFNPVRGIPNPAAALASLRSAFAGKAPRLQVSAPYGWGDLYARMLEKCRTAPPATAADEARLLQDLAVDEVGPAAAEDLVQVWLQLARTSDTGDLLRFAYPSTLGGVHQRWITRPFVPFPEELKPDEKAYYRPYLFQAKGETQADDLVDLQAMRLYKGWPGRMWVLNVYNRVDPAVRTARAHLQKVLAAMPAGAARRPQYERLDRQLRAFQLLCVNARNAVNYQAVLDYIKGRRAQGDRPDADPPLGTLETWDRKMIVEIARNEIDNTALLMNLLTDHPDLLLHAATDAGEEITLLGPDLPAQLRRKIDLMNAHWQDYNRLTTVPNP